MSKRVVATYEDPNEADAAIERLVHIGYPSEDISVITTPQVHTPDRDLKIAHHADLPEVDAVSGATSGSLVGGTLGVIIAGAFAAATAPAGADVLAVAGPIAAAIVGGGAGAAAGAVAGGAFGFLRGEGAAQDHADVGAVTVAVDTDGTHTAAVRSLLNTKTTVEPSV